MNSTISSIEKLRFVRFAKIVGMLFVCVLAAPSHALRLTMTLDDIIARSDLIIRGSVSDKRTLRAPLVLETNLGLVTDETVYTEYTFLIDEILLGSSNANSVSVYVNGGQYGDRIWGNPIGFKLNIDDDVVLFLKYDVYNKAYWGVEQNRGVYNVMLVDGDYILISTNWNEFIDKNGNIVRADSGNLAITLSELRETLNALR